MKPISSRKINIAVKGLVSLSLICGGEAFVVSAAQQTTVNKTVNKKKQTDTSSQKKKGGTSSKSTSANGGKTSASPKSKNNSATTKTTSNASKGASSKSTPAKGKATKGGVGQKNTSTATKSGSRKTAGKGGATETSADVRKRQEATRQEIKQTEQQIRENEQKVKSGLNELGKIQDEIGASKSKIATTSTQITKLTGEIAGLENGIAANEKELQRLRDEYLKAVKKMRLARGGNSALSFVFASENFSQALRRMRYLRQFSEWKERQSGVIDSTTHKLKSQREDLAKIKIQQDEVLKAQKRDQALLEEQFAKQDAIVAGLRQNGTALKSHLSKKQAEANQLNSRIAALIAEEQRKAEEARKAAEEKARKAAEEKARREAEERRLAEAKAAADKAAEEKRLAEKAAQEKLLADNAAKEKAANDKKAALEKKAKENAAKEIAAKEKAAAEKAAKDKAVADKAAKEKALADKAAKEKAAKDKESGQSFANARRRAPRNGQNTVAAVSKVESGGNTTSSSASSKSTAKSTGKSAGDFLAMKGSLPRPVSGAFRVTSRFGRQSLPDLPDIVYDNPGIDAEVASGASASAVFGGKVSGVYMIPGYNTVVIVNHGSYYTVYGNISSPSVKVGDAVNTGQKLGVLAPDEDNSGHSSIHFEVWRNREKLNPLEWIH